LTAFLTNGKSVLADNYSTTNITDTEPLLHHNTGVVWTNTSTSAKPPALPEVADIIESHFCHRTSVCDFIKALQPEN
jgi:hypothetical protein